MDEYIILGDHALNYEIYTVANTNGIFKICSHHLDLCFKMGMYSNSKDMLLHF
jgi:hypothetical protein